MKKLLFVAMLAAIGNAQATVYHYSMHDSYTGAEISGSFKGTESGNLIVDLSDITLAVNGVYVRGSGNLFAAQLIEQGFYWAPGAVASFDGKENNFMFINSDYVGGDYSYDAHFSSVSWFPFNFIQVGSFASAMNNPAYMYDWSVTPGRQIPEPTSLALFGLGIVGLSTLRRRMN